MIRLLQWLIIGHVHRWKETDRYELKDHDGDTIGRTVYCTCEKCGKPVMFKLTTGNAK